MADAMRSKFFVEMQRDLAVRTSAKVVPTFLQFLPLPFKVIEFAVYHDPDAFILIGNRLVARGQVDDTQASMPESHTLVRRDPGRLAVRSSMVQRSSGPLKRF